MSFPTSLAAANRRQANQEHLFLLVYTCAALSLFSTIEKHVQQPTQREAVLPSPRFICVVTAVRSLFLLLNSFFFPRGSSSCM